MPPVLLLHEPNPSFDTRQTIAQLAERVTTAERAEMRPGRWRQTFATLRRRGDEERVVHAFGPRALAAAVVVSRYSILYSPTRFPRRADVAWLRAVLRHRAIRILCASDAERRAWVTGGVPIDCCTLVRPGVSMATSGDARRTARERFGYGDTDRVIFVPVPRLGRDRSDAVWTGVLLNVLHANVRTLAWSDGGLDTLHALRSRLITPDAFAVLDDPSPEAGFAAADAVLLPPGDVVPPTIVAMAMANGRPTVAQATPQVCELLEDRHTALLTAGRTPRLLAERMIDLFADAELARKLGDRARVEAYEHLRLSRKIGEIRSLYQAMVDSSALTDSDASVVTGG